MLSNGMLSNEFISNGFLADNLLTSKGNADRITEVFPSPITDAVIVDSDDGQEDDGCTWKIDLALDAMQLKQKDALQPLLDALHRIPGIEPNAMRIETVLHELYSNAVDHGVLELSSALKSNAAGFKEFYRLREQGLAQLTKGFVRIHLAYFSTMNGGTLMISMQDSGDGFDYQRYFGFISSQQNASRQVPVHMIPYGRGLMLAHSLCEYLRFFGNGNQVVAQVSWKTAH